MFYYLKCLFKTKTYPKYQRKEQINLQICCAVVRVLQVLLSSQGWFLWRSLSNGSFGAVTVIISAYLHISRTDIKYSNKGKPYTRVVWHLDNKINTHQRLWFIL